MSEEELFNKVNALLQKYDQPAPKPENKPLTPQTTLVEEPQEKLSDEDKKSNDSNKDSEKDEESSVGAELEEINDCIGGHSSENSFSENDDYKHLKEELDKGNNFIDYFLVVGVEPNIFLNRWLYDSDLETLNKDYKNKLEPKIISSFPQFEKHTISFDESILLHCFPNGYKLIQTSKRPQPKLFSFILDNNYFNLNYPQKYLTCLICYESIAQYRMLYEQNKRLPKNEENKKKYENITENDYDKIKNTTKNKDIYIPKCLLFMSLCPHFGEFEKILIEIYNYSQGIKYINTPTIVQTPEKKSEEINLKDITNIEINIPIDKIIENLLIELPIPPRGFSTVEYSLNDEKQIIAQSKMNELPLVNINLKRLFIDFEVKEILDIYNTLFLEGRILFFSKYIELLNIYIYGFLSLLYPFQYQYQIVTILPEKNFEIMESITPFIAGINQPYEKDFFDKRDFTLSDSILIVDIDKGCIEMCNEVNKFPEFPKNPRKNIEKNLILIVNKYLKEEIKSKKQILGKSARESINLPSSVIIKNNEVKKKNTLRASVRKPRTNKAKVTIMDENDDVFSNFNIDYNFNKEVNEVFFNFNASLLGNYSKFLNLDFYSSNIMPCLEILFKVDAFLKEVPQTEKDFYERFVSETQLFGDFLYLRMIPKNNKEKIRILRFDEKIMENTSSLFNRSSDKIIFTNCKEYEFTDKYEISKPRKLTEKEITTYEKLKTRKILLNYGIITSEKKDNIINFYYPVFPKLTTKLFFYQNAGEYYPPQNSWNESIESANEYVISKSHLGGVSFRQNDMKNYVYLCWMQMWAMTFWYCEEKEQNYRFQELLKVLDKTSCHEMEIFNLLFETLSKYGKNDNMILKLYAILLKLHLNPSSKVHKIVMNLIDKNQLEGNFNEKLQKILEKDKSVIYEKKDFRKRVFRSKYYEDNILTESIIFFAFDNCVDCQNPIDLEKISKNFEQMSRDLVWTKCPSCNEPLLPKILIQFGKEINKNGELKKNTSNLANVVLFSPYILKVNYSTILLKNFGVKLDVEELMPKYSGIFWDSLWYFKLNGLEYDFMLPYERDSNKKFVKTDNLMIMTTANKGKDIQTFDKENLEKINTIDVAVK